MKYNIIKFRQVLYNSNILVNSQELLQKYSLFTRNIHQVITTTLSVNDFYFRDFILKSSKFKLLFAGNIHPTKGLHELLNAFLLLKNKILNIELYFVGWDAEASNKNLKYIESFALYNKLTDSIFYLGKKKIGLELLSVYRECDLFILPSYHEGFPRTIWEALSNSLPVITTKVGGIPYMLEHKKHAYLVNPKSVDELVDAVLELHQDSNLRSTLVSNGFNLAKKATLEQQADNILTILNKY